MRDWLVAADDRTGAFEVAALFAAVVGPVTVTAGDPPSGAGVVDLETRAMPATEAARVAATVDDVRSTWVGHKIDSTLRGNWAAELTTRQQATGRRVVVLPGWPELGRTSVGGVVFVDGAPIGNVLDDLAGADLLADAGALRAWLDGTGSIAVCDVPSTEAMHAAAAVLAGHDVLVAGPAGPLGAVFAAAHPPGPTPRAVRVTNPALVMCGSAHPIAREQIRRLRAARPDVEVLATAVPAGALHTRAIVVLAERARKLIERLRPRTIVIVGGDTAAELLGSSPRVVGGFAAVGMPWSFEEGDAGPLVITKAGGFGGPDALVELLRGETG